MSKKVYCNKCDKILSETEFEWVKAEKCIDCGKKTYTKDDRGSAYILCKDCEPTHEQPSSFTPGSVRDDKAECNYCKGTDVEIDIKDKNYWCDNCKKLVEKKTCSSCQKDTAKTTSVIYCKEKRNGQKCGKPTHVELGSYGLELEHIYEYKEHDQKCPNCEKEKFFSEFSHIEGGGKENFCNDCWWDRTDPEEKAEIEKWANSTNAQEKRDYQEYKKLKDKKSKGNNDNEREQNWGRNCYFMKRLRNEEQDRVMRKSLVNLLSIFATI